MHVGYHFSLVITFIFMSLQGTSNKSRPATAATAAGGSITLPVNKGQLPVYKKVNKQHHQRFIQFKSST